MEIIYLPNASDHLNYWIKTKNLKTLEKIATLLKNIVETPKYGIGNLLRKVS